MSDTQLRQQHEYVIARNRAAREAQQAEAERLSAERNRRNGR
jgi:hypothetical protein